MTLARHFSKIARGLPEKRPISGVEKVVLVASGKGGVGKSTTAVNLAVSLSLKFGKKTGLLDADVYGPSVPIMMGLAGRSRPPVSPENLMEPPGNHGVQCMSMGFLVEPEKAAVWRGPMITGAVAKMAFGTAWDKVDVLIVDLPPGTGDVHLSVAQSIQNVSGAVFVTTPQKVALADAAKSVAMTKLVNIPVLGLVENMSSFVCPKCGETTSIFGQRASNSIMDDVVTLGKIPLEPEIMTSSDSGTPVVVSSPGSKTAETYNAIAGKILGII